MFRNLLNPKKVDEYFTREVAKADWSRIITNVVIGTVVLLVAGLIEFAMLSSMVDFIYSISGDYTPAVVSEAFSLVSVFVSAVQNFVLFFVFGAVLFGVAKVLGGKGDLLPQFYLGSIVMVVYSVISAVFSLLGVIPCIACITAILMLALAVYALFLHYKLVKIVHKVDNTKAAIILVVYLIIATGVVLAVVALNLLLGLATGPGFESFESLTTPPAY